MSESRVEEYLKAAMTEEKESDLPAPRSRVEKLLKNIADADYQPRTHYVEKAFEDITWDGDTTGKAPVPVNNLVYYKVSDQTPAYEQLLGATLVTPTGKAVTVVEKANVAGEVAMRWLNDNLLYGMHFVVVYTPTSVDGISFPSTGVYFAVSYGSHTISLKAKETVHQLDEKYLPDTIARTKDINAAKDYILVNSSTEGSTKKFKITVDDTGLITATEVTE